MAKKDAKPATGAEALVAELNTKIEGLTPEAAAELLIAEVVAKATELEEVTASAETLKAELASATEKIETLESTVAELMENVSNSSEVKKENHLKVGGVVYKLVTPVFYLKTKEGMEKMDAEKLSKNKQYAEIAIESGNLVPVKGEKE